MAIATTYAPLSPYIVDPATGKLDKQYRDFFQGIEFVQGGPIASVSLDPNRRSGEGNQLAACSAPLAKPARDMSRPIVKRATLDDVARFVELGFRFYDEEGGRAACPMR